MRRHDGGDSLEMGELETGGGAGRPERSPTTAGRTPEHHTGAQVRANLFLVGAPKAGTTSLDRLLRGHPDVFLSPIKEPCHFCPDVAAQLARKSEALRELDMERYLAGPERHPVHLARVPSPQHYARLFEGGAGRTVVGECSTYYLSSAEAPGRIHAYNPDAKILVLVRDPVERIRSHYAMDRARGLVDRPLPALLEEELALGDAADWGNSRFYVGASRYRRQIEAYRRWFPPERICVLSFEHLRDEPQQALETLFRFLGIAPPEQPVALPRANPSRAARFQWLHHGLRKSGLKPLIAKLVKPGRASPAGSLIRSAYYRREARVVSDEELERVRRLLANEALD